MTQTLQRQPRKCRTPISSRMLSQERNDDWVQNDRGMLNSNGRLSAICRRAEQIEGKYHSSEIRHCHQSFTIWIEATLKRLPTTSEVITWALTDFSLLPEKQFKRYYHGTEAKMNVAWTCCLKDFLKTDFQDAFQKWIIRWQKKVYSPNYYFEDFLFQYLQKLMTHFSGISLVTFYTNPL